jgi:hypothetical protein
VPISVRGEKPRKNKQFSGGSEMKITRGMLLRWLAGVCARARIFAEDLSRNETFG